MPKIVQSVEAMSHSPELSQDPEAGCKKEELTHVDFANDQNNMERSAAEKKLVWKQDLRIVPLSAAIFLLCYLDRSNIGRCLDNVLVHGSLY